jgi:cobalamin synthase
MKKELSFPALLEKVNVGFSDFGAGTGALHEDGLADAIDGLLGR